MAELDEANRWDELDDPGPLVVGLQSLNVVYEFFAINL
jgi:hypothetical protein